MGIFPGSGTIPLKDIIIVHNFNFYFLKMTIIINDSTEMSKLMRNTNTMFKN